MCNVQPSIMTQYEKASSTVFESVRKAQSVQHPQRPYHNVLVFDVETTGLLPKKVNTAVPVPSDAAMTEDPSFVPHIIQLSYILFNVDGFYIRKKYNAYIKIDDTIELSEKITEITGITRNILQKRGIPIQEALQDFYQAYWMADCVIAHNISFDRKMIEIEMERNMSHLSHLPRINQLFQAEDDIYCTMKSSINICNIMIQSKFNENKTYKKMPKLSELYEYLFKEIPENLHNSLIDTLVCLRCFLKIRLHRDIHDIKYKHIMRSILMVK